MINNDKIVISAIRIYLYKQVKVIRWYLLIIVGKPSAAEMNTIHLALLVVSVAVIKNVRADCDGSTKLGKGSTIDKQLLETRRVNFISDEGVTQDEINTIVDTHNGIRRLICQGQPNGQPQGVNLKKMVIIELLALVFTIQCLSAIIINILDF